MSRTLRVVAALALVTAGLVWLPRISAQAGGQPSTKNGEWPHYTADSEEAAATRRSIRSTPPTSTSSKSRGGSRPTTSDRFPNTSSKERR